MLNSDLWVEKICNSSYKEKIFDPLVPTMTSDTEPSGIASASAYMSGRNPYCAFAKQKPDYINYKNYWFPANDNNDHWLAYEFTRNYTVQEFICNAFANVTGNYKITVQAFIENDWINVKEVSKNISNDTNQVNENIFIYWSKSYSSKKWRICTHQESTSTTGVAIALAQFYGRP